MHTDILDALRCHASTQARDDGICSTMISGLTLIRISKRTALPHTMQKPQACLVLQGCMLVTMGKTSLHFSPGDALLVTATAPAAGQITKADTREPYLALVLDLDLGIIADLAAEMSQLEGATHPPISNEKTDEEVAVTALRLMRLLKHPASIPVLKAALLRELHYWLLLGAHGHAMRRLAMPTGYGQRIARAIATLRAEFTRRLSVESLAAEVGMSLSTFHQHFRAVTSLTPLQFQKQLRLIEAKRLMLAEGLNASNAALRVGYESVNQFTREYGRMFGLPPSRDTRATGHRLHSQISPNPAMAGSPGTIVQGGRHGRPISQPRYTDVRETC